LPIKAAVFEGNFLTCRYAVYYSHNALRVTRCRCRLLVVSLLLFNVVEPVPRERSSDDMYIVDVSVSDESDCCNIGQHLGVVSRAAAVTVMMSVCRES